MHDKIYELLTLISYFYVTTGLFVYEMSGGEHELRIMTVLRSMST